jgi:hypothetical protein
VELIAAKSTLKSPVAIVHKATANLTNFINCLGGADTRRDLSLQPTV